LEKACNIPERLKGQHFLLEGGKSNYVNDEDRAVINSLFPNSTLITMDTGHWVQAEKPQEFVDVVKNFLNSTTT
jgi:esterase